MDLGPAIAQARGSTWFRGLVTTDHFLQLKYSQHFHGRAFPGKSPGSRRARVGLASRRSA
jgi:hypothetical protein